MKLISILIAVPLFVGLLASCSAALYPSNGENIYRSGRNEQDTMMLDKKQSSITIIKSCQGCHGPKGDRMKKVNIRFASLSDPRLHEVPYTDSLLVRFIDDDLKSNGEKANIGVRWKMSEKDKQDLIAFLKTL